MSINTWTLGQSVAYLSYALKSNQDFSDFTPPDNPERWHNRVVCTCAAKCN
ncbi:hypothetical protein JXA70_19940 [candidate division KSB1 bacterium]|nr:hypothetical protein [candidate division KSB1 bacterium]